jgi:hypothetical protein
VTSRPAAAQHLRDLARLRRVRDRIDREYAQPLDASLAFCRDTPGFEVRNAVGHGKMRWITVGPADRPARPSSCTRRPPTPASPTTSAAPSQR